MVEVSIIFFNAFCNEDLMPEPKMTVGHQVIHSRHPKYHLHPNLH